MRERIITTSVELERPLDEVRTRLRELTEELRLPIRPGEADIELVASTGDAVVVAFDESGCRGFADVELSESGDIDRSKLEVTVRLYHLPWWARALSAGSAGKRRASRLVTEMARDLLEDDLDDAPVQIAPIPHDPTRPAIEEPGVATILARSRWWLVGGWVAAGGLAALCLGVIALLEGREDHLVRTGDRVPAVVSAFDEEEWVISVEAADPPLTYETYADREYSVGQEVVMLHDPSRGWQMIEGEAYSDSVWDTVGAVGGVAAAIVVSMGAVLMVRRWRVRRILTATPFQEVEVSPLLGLTSRGRWHLRLFHDDGSRFDIVRTSIEFSRGAELAIEELPPRCLGARAGRRVVLWRPDLAHLVVASTARSRWRTRRWERRAERW